MKVGGLLITGLICILFASSACAAEDPATISADDLSISLNADTIPDEFWDMGVDFEVRKDNSVRTITVSGADVATYQNIHVGDPINKVRSKYLMEYEEDDYVAALINGETELDLASVIEMDEKDFTDEILDAVFLQYTYADAPVMIIVNKDGIVRGIRVFGRTVQTYDEITVGKNKADIVAKYEKYNDNQDYVDVYYNGDELLAKEDMPVDDYFCYSYRTDEAGTILSILICDKQFATMMK